MLPRDIIAMSLFEGMQNFTKEALKSNRIEGLNQIDPETKLYNGIHLTRAMSDLEDPNGFIVPMAAPIGLLKPLFFNYLTIPNPKGKSILHIGVNTRHPKILIPDAQRAVISLISPRKQIVNMELNNVGQLSEFIDTMATAGQSLTLRAGQLLKRQEVFDLLGM